MGARKLAVLHKRGELRGRWLAAVMLALVGSSCFAPTSSKITGALSQELKFAKAPRLYRVSPFGPKRELLDNEPLLAGDKLVLQLEYAQIAKVDEGTALLARVSARGGAGGKEVFWPLQLSEPSKALARQRDWEHVVRQHELNELSFHKGLIVVSINQRKIGLAVSGKALLPKPEEEMSLLLPHSRSFSVRLAGRRAYDDEDGLPLLVEYGPVAVKGQLTIGRPGSSQRMKFYLNGAQLADSHNLIVTETSSSAEILVPWDELGQAPVSFGELKAVVSIEGKEESAIFQPPFLTSLTSTASLASMSVEGVGSELLFNAKVNKVLRPKGRLLVNFDNGGQVELSLLPGAKNRILTGSYVVADTELQPGELSVKSIVPLELVDEVGNPLVEYAPDQFEQFQVNSVFQPDADPVELESEDQILGSSTRSNLSYQVRAGNLEVQGLGADASWQYSLDGGKKWVTVSTTTTALPDGIYSKKSLRRLRVRAWVDGQPGTSVTPFWEEPPFVVGSLESGPLALRIDSNDLVNSHNRLVFPPAQTARSVAFWARTTVWKLDNDPRQVLFSADKGEVEIFLYNDSASQSTVNVQTSVEIQSKELQDYWNWHHYLLVKEGSELTLYLDGVKQFTLATRDAHRMSRLVFGNTSQDSGHYQLAGFLKGVQIWYQIFDQQAASQLYALGEKIPLNMAELVAYYPLNRNLSDAVAGGPALLPVVSANAFKPGLASISGTIGPTLQNAATLMKVPVKPVG